MKVWLWFVAACLVAPPAMAQFGSNATRLAGKRPCSLTITVNCIPNADGNGNVASRAWDSGIPRVGLVAWWKLGGAALGTSIPDLSGKGHTLTWAVATEPYPLASTMNFLPVSNPFTPAIFAQTPSTSDLNFAAGSYTILAYVKAPASGNRCVVCKSSNADATNFRFVMNPGVLRLYWGSDAQPYTAGTGTLLGNTWQTVGVGYDALAGQSLTIVGTSMVAVTETNHSVSNALALFIGADTAGLLPFSGYISQVAIYNRKLTQTEIAAWDAYCAATRLAQAGAVRLVFDGDSLTAGTNASGIGTNYPSQVLSNLNISPLIEEFYNFGVAGQTLTDMNSDAATQIDAMIAANPMAKNILVVDGGTNDMGSGGGSQTGTTTFARLKTYCAARRAAAAAAGYTLKIVVNTAMNGNSSQTEHNTFNGLIRGDASFYDALADVQADPRLQTTSNTTYFAVDAIHLTDLGYAIKAAIVTQAIASLF